MRIPLLLVVFVLPAGCELLQPRQAGTPDGPPPIMMIADTVPLASEGKPHEAGRPMPVPVEPSPFVTNAKGKPMAMKSDLEKHARRKDAQPRAIPKEPVPSANMAN